MSPSDARVLILRFHPYPKRHFPVKKDDALRRPDFPCAAFPPRISRPESHVFQSITIISISFRHGASAEDEPPHVAPF